MDIYGFGIPYGSDNICMPNEDIVEAGHERKFEDDRPRICERATIGSGTNGLHNERRRKELHEKLRKTIKELRLKARMTYLMFQSFALEMTKRGENVYSRNWLFISFEQNVLKRGMNFLIDMTSPVSAFTSGKRNKTNGCLANSDSHNILKSYIYCRIESEWNCTVLSDFFKYSNDHWRRDGYIDGHFQLSFIILKFHSYS